MSWILGLLPDGAMVLVIMAIGFALMCGLLRPKRAFTMLGGLVLMLVLSPFISALVEALPFWLLAILLLLFGLSLLRALSNFVIGPGATDEMVGTLAADVVRSGVRAAFFILTLPFRAIGWLLRGVL